MAFKLFDKGVKFEVIENEVAITKDDKTFYVSMDRIEEHLNERWMEDESVFINVYGENLELFNRDYRYLKQKIEEAI